MHNSTSTFYSFLPKVKIEDFLTSSSVSELFSFIEWSGISTYDWILLILFFESNVTRFYFFSALNLLIRRIKPLDSNGDWEFTSAEAECANFLYLVFVSFLSFVVIERRNFFWAAFLSIFFAGISLNFYFESFPSPSTSTVLTDMRRFFGFSAICTLLRNFKVYAEFDAPLTKPLMKLSALLVWGFGLTW